MDELLKKIAELRAKLAELKDGERTLENAQKLKEMRADLDTAQADLETAQAEKAEIDTAFADAEGDKDAPADTDGDKQEPAPAAPVTMPAPVETDGGDKDGVDAADTAPVAPTGHVALAASGADRSGGSVALEIKGPAPMVLVASGNGAGIAPGAPLDRDTLGAVLTAAASAAGGMAPRTRVVSFDRFGGGDVKSVSDMNSTIENTRLIAAARGAYAAADLDNRPVALTAAGCFCGPDELIKLTNVVGRRGRPFAAMFPTIPISGGFRAQPDLAFNVDTDLRAGVSQWTCTDQGLVDPDDSSTWKPCAELRCFTETTYTPYAVEACITVERFHRWAHPEQIDAWVNLLGIEYDALAETLLIDQVEAEAGTPLTVGAAAGLMVDFSMLAKVVYALGSLSYPLGYQFREGAGVLAGYTLSVPVGMAEALWADEKLRGFPSGLTTKEQIIAMIQSSTGVRIVERLDESTSRKAAAAATVAAMNAGGAIDSATGGRGATTYTPLLPPTFRMYLIPTAGYVHGEGTIVAADWMVDDPLLRQNKMRYFLENVEILANLSVRKPHIIDIPGEIIGAYTDLVLGPGNT